MTSWRTQNREFVHGLSLGSGARGADLSRGARGALAVRSVGVAAPPVERLGQRARSRSRLPRSCEPG